MPCRPSVKPSGSARFVIQGPHLGLRVRGNIDLWTRPIVRHGAGWATVLSISIGTDAGEVLIPRVIAGQGVVSEDRAVRHYRRTGRHLGIFDTSRHADLYGERLHRQQAHLYCLDRRF